MSKKDENDEDEDEEIQQSSVIFDKDKPDSEIKLSKMSKFQKRNQSKLINIIVIAAYMLFKLI